jgi:membrane protein
MPVTLGVSFFLSETIQDLLGKEYLAIGTFAFLPFLMIWMLFFVLFKVSPNMKISLRVAFKVSLVVSVVWHVAKWLFVKYTVMNQTYASLYGSFSELLFMLVWIYLSWLLLLHGLRACYLMHCHNHKYD